MLSDLEVLAIDCQATAASPRGYLIEIGWVRVGATAVPARARLIRVPARERIPPAVVRITGISDRMMQDAVDGSAAWLELSKDAASLTKQPAPTVIHFARFEQPFLRALAGGTPPLDIVCTHDIARRLLPDLPRRSLRALTGYFGRAVGALRRSADHVEATAFVWRQLMPLLEAEGVSTWGALHEWLAAPADCARRARRVWPMPRDTRLAVPDAPGVYRMLRTSGDVLYVGKASSLHHRVNSYFRKQSRVHERMLEMLSQARAIAFETTPSALEAALLECDEIKRLRPPYNIALTGEDRDLWFTARDLGERRRRPTPRCPLGPFPSAEVLDQFAALADGNRAALANGRWGPDPAVFEAGYARLCAAHPELSHCGLSPRARLLRLGTRLWREGRRDRDDDEEVTAWTPEQVQTWLEWLALRAALARRRARWFTRLLDASVVWTEPGATDARLLVIENGEIVARSAANDQRTPPIPPGYQRPIAARREAFTLARFDRLRVLTTEFKRVVAEHAPVAIRFGAGPPLVDERLARALSRV